MSKNDEVIPIPESPAGATTTPTFTDIETPGTSAPSSAASNSDAPLRRNLIEKQPDQRDKNKLSKRLKRCRDKTLESELCRTINKYAKSLMSDDQCRRSTAIVILILAVIGVYHILRAIL
jgi:hypothetical protein